MSRYIEYKFDRQNPFWDLIDPYGEGLKRLEVHDIINAILCFEAAVQKKSDYVDVSSLEIFDLPVLVHSPFAIGELFSPRHCVYNLR